ncbi:MAG: GTPase HflX [Desulfarculaceae bacterium]
MALSRLSQELGRRLGLVGSRRGEVVRILVGGPQSLPEPDLTRLRRGRSRLAGYFLLQTVLGEQKPGRKDLARLVRRRWDLLASLEVGPDGLPGLIHVAHLLPQPVGGQDLRQLQPFAPGHPPEDLARLVRSLEEELARLAPLRRVKDAGEALLISVTKGPRAEAEERLDELADLARSAGLRVLGRVIQRRRQIDPRTLLGPGKLEEVLLLALRRNAQVLVFDQELTPSQAQSLAAATGQELKFLDRTQLILDIFAQQASTREGKLQVEMAQLRYLMPRLGGRDDGLSRLTGGIGGRGPGETRLEIDRRRVRQRLHRLSRELEEVGRQRQRRRARRGEGGLPVLSIVGYTNAGKSTLLNALTGSKVLCRNRLFATLDPTTRRLRFPREREVIITDTVGFIRDLPAELRRAFAATLEELHQADLLLHLADAANPQVELQIQAVEAILNDLGLGRIPCLLVLNKMDRADSKTLARLQRRFQAVPICALDPATLSPLLERMQKMAFAKA